MLFIILILGVLVLGFVIRAVNNNTYYDYDKFKPLTVVREIKDFDDCDEDIRI